MNKYEEYINHLEDKRNILEIRYDKKLEEKYNLINDNYDIETRVETLTEQIEELEDIIQIFNEYDKQKNRDEKANKLFKRNSLVFTIGGLLGTAAGLLTSHDNFVTLLVKGVLISVGVPTISIGIKKIIENTGKRAYYKRVVKENNLDDIQFKLNRKKKKKQKLEETYERNNLKIITLNEKIEILKIAMKDFNNLKYKAKRLYVDALDYAKEVQGYDIDSKFPKYYENTINNHFKEDEEIKDIMKRERKLDNDN